MNAVSVRFIEEKRKMTVLDEIETAPPIPPDLSPRRSPWFAAAVLALCGLLIFAHFGCHGDEDTELLVQSSYVDVDVCNR